MKIKQIEAIRGFAALYVLIYHYIIEYPQSAALPLFIRVFFHFGQEAVILFFLISGFVIYLSVAKNRNMTFGKYILRRAVRIYPILIVAFILSILTALMNGYQFGTDDWKSLAGNVFMLQDSYLKPGYIVIPFLNNFPLWSLSYEWWFYLMFYPVFYYFLKRAHLKSFSAYIVLLISATGWVAYIIHPNHLLLVLAYFSLWWSGVTCAEVYLQYKTFTFKNLLPAIIPLAVMTCLMFVPIINTYISGGKLILNRYPILTLRHYAFALAVVFAGLIWWKFKLVKFGLVFGWFERLAPISYALYVTHYIFIHFYSIFISNVYIEIVLDLALTFLVAYLLEVHLQPFVNKLVFFGNKTKVTELAKSLKSKIESLLPGSNLKID